MVTRRDVAQAVQQVRKHFAETQPQFALRMKTAVVTIARWETSRPPRGKPLEELMALAEAENLADCVEVFREALSGHIEPTSASSRQPSPIFQNGRERLLALALITALRAPEEYGAVVRSIESTLGKVLQDYKACFDEGDIQTQVARAVVKLTEKGESPERIAEALEMDLVTVKKVLMFDLFDLLPRVVLLRGARRTHLASRVRRAGAAVRVAVRKRRSSPGPKRQQGLSELVKRYFKGEQLETEGHDKEARKS